MTEPLLERLFATFVSFGFALLLLPLTLVFFRIFAWIVQWVLWQAVRTRARVRRERIGAGRNRTLRLLISSMANLIALLLTLIVVLLQFISAGTLATTLGLFSAGIGFAARPFISDVLGGLVLLFEDQFALGEKVEIGDRNVVGVVEEVSLRTTHVRGEAGELWIVPNGDVRTLRNFSRAIFSPANVRLTVPTSQFEQALAILQQIQAAPGQDVLEAPEIISEEGQIGETTTLMLKVKAAYSHSPAVRQRLIAEIQHAMREQGLLGETTSPADDEH